MQTIKTNERTLNKKVKSQSYKLMPNAKFCKKMHVAGVGYVTYFKDANKNILGKIYKYGLNGMVIALN